MHTILVLTGGFVLLAICLLLARLAGKPTGGAVLVFIPLWLIATGVNMWVGVSQAGYSVADETPIFLLLFVVPTALALYLRHRAGRKTNSP